MTARRRRQAGQGSHEDVLHDEDVETEQCPAVAGGRLDSRVLADAVGGLDLAVLHRLEHQVRCLPLFGWSLRRRRP